jgi:Site-specific recombinase XerD
VFTTRRGTPIDPDNFARYFHRLCECACLGHSTSHEHRHSAASIMLAQGAPLRVVSEVLGHASVAITMDIYGHLIGGEKAETTEAITDVLFKEGLRRGEADGKTGRDASVQAWGPSTSRSAQQLVQTFRALLIRVGIGGFGCGVVWAGWAR